MSLKRASLLICTLHTSLLFLLPFIIFNISHSRMISKGLSYDYLYTIWKPSCVYGHNSFYQVTSFARTSDSIFFYYKSFSDFTVLLSCCCCYSAQQKYLYRTQKKKKNFFDTLSLILVCSITSSLLLRVNWNQIKVHFRWHKKSYSKHDTNSFVGVRLYALQVL